MSFIPGMFPGSIGKIPATISYVGNSDNTADATSYTFTGLGVGSAAPGRKVVIGVGANGTATGFTVTFGGNAMTQLGFVDGTNATLGIYAIDDASATTANVVITNVSGSNFACRVWVWNVFNGNSTAFSTASDIVPSGSTPGTVFWGDIFLNCPDGSVIVGVAMDLDNFTGAPGATWTGLTERQDSTLEAGTDNYTAADATVATATPSYTIRQSWSSPTLNGGGLLAVCL